MKEFKYTINGNSYTVEIIKEDGAEVELTVNGTAYTVEIEEEITEEPKKITRPAAAPTKPTGEPVLGTKKNVSAGGAVKAPLPGVVLEVCVKVGDTVKVGDKVLLLEAMKMENTIASDIAGKVLEIKVEAGVTVLEGTEMIMIG
ncbi:MAG TPA: biotin/lipoyl-containing protein [Bacteroidales bacterium]|nr:biotin/lipoyl-containing protein [Bacteroidales bacterium]